MINIDHIIEQKRQRTDLGESAPAELVYQANCEVPVSKRIRRVQVVPQAADCSGKGADFAAQA